MNQPARATASKWERTPSTKVLQYLPGHYRKPTNRVQSFCSPPSCPSTIRRVSHHACEDDFFQQQQKIWRDRQKTVGFRACLLLFVTLGFVASGPFLNATSSEARRETAERHRRESGLIVYPFFRGLHLLLPPLVMPCHVRAIRPWLVVCLPHAPGELWVQ
mgnify:CR=1 FL=1